MFIFSLSVGWTQFSRSNTDRTLKTKPGIGSNSPLFFFRCKSGCFSASTIGVIASSRLEFLRLPSWLPRITYVGAMSAKFLRKSEAKAKYSGLNCVFVCAISPQCTIKSGFFFFRSAYSCLNTALYSS